MPLTIIKCLSFALFFLCGTKTWRQKNKIYTFQIGHRRFLLKEKLYIEFKSQIYFIFHSKCVRHLSVGDILFFFSVVFFTFGGALFSRFLSFSLPFFHYFTKLHSKIVRFSHQVQSQTMFTSIDEFTSFTQK